MGPPEKTSAEKWGVVVLAAGASSRMGTPKQLLQWDGESLLRRATQTALAWNGGGPVCIVLGANAYACTNEFVDLPVMQVWNAQWESGMASSLRVGVQAVLEAEPGISGLLVLLCDQPRVGAESLAHLFAAHQKAGLPVTTSAYNETFGVPALFGRVAFPDLLKVSGAEGAKSVVKRFVSAGQACFVPIPEAAADLDTPGDYARLREVQSSL